MRPRFMFSRRAALTGLLGAGAALTVGRAVAQDNTFAQMDAAIADRVAKMGGSGVLAVVKDGRLVHTAGFGGMDPRARYRVFSLSKAVTGLAVATLVQKGKLDLEAPIERYVGALLKKYGPPADGRVNAVTVRQTMIHMGGFTSNERGDDPIIIGKEGFVPPKGRERDAKSWRKEDVLPGILKRKLDAAPGAQYIYSNAGYVILGLIVEAASGMGYEEFCREAVFKPIGLALPTIEADRRFIDSVSGWQMTPAEVMKLWAVYEPGDTRLLTPELRQQVFAPSGAFLTDQRKSYYTFGISIQEFRPGSFIWFHTGRGQYGPKEQQVVTFATHGPTVSLVWAVRPSMDIQGVLALDRDVWVAVRAIKDWPPNDLYPQYGF